MKPTVVKFFAPVVDVTINALMNTADQKMKQGAIQFILLISSPGGSVFHELSGYNYLKGVLANITTHNLRCHSA
jgi:ATP-dependent protease ClpP protease subunit